MKIGLTGATGLIGQSIIALANGRGHRVIGFSRHPAFDVPGCVETRRFFLDETPNVGGCDAIIHLAGENIFGFWTHRKMRRILQSRELGTRCIVEAIRASKVPPRVLVSGSAIGFYGETGETPADETSPAGRGFLTEVTQVWEREALRARDENVRVVLLRSAVVLGKNGGALAMMAPVFRAGLGGKSGSGQQWMSWIHLDDEAALALFAAENETVQGPLNATTPNPVRNVDFTRELAQTLHRPAIFTLPTFVLRTLTGEFSRELLDSKRIAPRAALEKGFVFRHPSLAETLADLLN